MAESPKAPELTKPSEFLVPNQDLIERVIDQRLASHSAFEETSSKPKAARSTAASKGDDKS